MKKRSRQPPKQKHERTTNQTEPEEEEELGALEFAAALNGEDPRHILGCLKRFVKIVRQDRLVALGKSKDKKDGRYGEDLSSSEEEGDEEEIGESGESSPKKKFKPSESWKEDSRDYHVPFVGTAVARGGRDRGTVVVGQWPTGLLKAYLERSPLAVELTGDTLIPPAGHIHKTLLRNKQGKLSQNLYKTYLKALAELVTAAIPKEALEQELSWNKTPPISEQSKNSSSNSNSDWNNRFLIAIVKDRIPGLLNLLQEETKRGKGNSGPLSPVALQVLSRVAMTSTDNSRHLVRSVEQSLSEGVWKAIVRLPPIHKQQKDESHSGVKHTSNSQREVGRIAVLMFARALVQTCDSTVFHYSSSPGSKDRKVSPGLLVLALRDAYKDTFESSDSINPTRKSYYVAIARFLQALRQALWDPARLLAVRRWAELFSVDVLHNLCDISLHAPPLGKPNEFRNVLNANDAHTKEDSTPLKQAGMEARRLLWSLLVDPSRSPLLQVIQYGKTSMETKNNHTEQAIIRSVCRLLDSQPSSGRLGLHACIHHGIRTVPTLLPPLFQKLTVPDCTKQSFSFLARLRFVAQLLEGPLPSRSLTKNIKSYVLERNVDAILEVVSPLALKKNVYSKSIQSKNALIVSETLKALVCVLKRLEKVKKEVEECKTDETMVFWDKLSVKIMGFLPDIQVVLSTPSRFDLMSGDPSAIIVYGHLAQLLLSYKAVLPGVLQEVKFDWIKLLPSSSGRFCALPLFLQARLLRTLEAVLELSEVSTMTPASCRTLLEILTRGKSRCIHDVAKRICCLVLKQLVPGKDADDEILLCLNYEISCWVDCMTPSDIPEFCSVLQQASELSFRSDISFLRSWNKAGLPKPIPKLPVSPILIAFIAALQTGSYPKRFTVLLNQVATKCLLYHHNPLPLACLITYFYQLNTVDGAATSTPDVNNLDSTALFEYANSLVAFDKFTGSDREDRLRSLLTACFSKDGIYHKVAGMLSGEFTEKGMAALLKNCVNEDLSAVIRQVLHMVATNGSKKFHGYFLSFIRLFLPIVLESCSQEADLLLRNLYSRLECCDWADFKYIDLCVLSQGQSLPGTVIHRVQRAAQTTVEETAGGSKGILASEQRRNDLLSLVTLRGFLPLQVLDKFTKGLLRFYCTRPVDHFSYSSLAKFTVGCIQELLVRADAGFSHSSSGADVVFDSWMSLIGNFAAIGSDGTVFTELIVSLERLMCTYFSTYSVAPAQIFASSLRHAPEDILERIFTARALSRTNIPSGACILVYFLEFDSSRFKLPFIQSLSHMHEHDRLKELWTTGAIDEAVLFLLSCSERSKDQKGNLQNIVRFVVDRALAIFPEKGASCDLEENSMVLEMLSRANKELLATTEKRITLANEIANALKSPTFMKTTLRKMEISTQLALFRVAVVLSDVMDETDDAQVQAKSILSTTLFVRLNEILPRSLKKYTKALGGNHPVGEVLEPAVIINWMCPIVGEFPSFEMKCLASLDPNCTSASLRACLKYGMINFEGMEAFAGIAPDCLRLARELVLGITPGSSSSENEPGEFPPTSEVYEMVVSHSNFFESLEASSDGLSGARKLELLRLLLSCVSLSKTTIIFDAVIWEALFRTYKAGVDAADRCLRRLLYVATKKQEGTATLPYMDQFRWRGVSLDDSNSQNQNLWDWLLNGLELGRVRQTLQSFPIDDGIIPSPVSEVELWAAAVESSSMDIDEQDGETSAFNSVDDSCGEAPSLTMKTIPDSRYSPGYILPLVLAALENCMEEAGSRFEKSKQNTKTESSHTVTMNDADPRHERLARVAQRLCEKGALALTLGALCSKCSSLRQVAVSILGFFIRALDTNEARDLSSWRERPQLAMLLHSVQRSLAIRRSVLLSEAQNNGHDPSESQAWVIPLFPGFSAVFLARACLVLTRPSDDMYAPLNRFFLSIESDHGAFRDMNRLPAFIAMLCSSADEPAGQAATERLWALELFRDGFLNSFCFKMASTCHAPELLLTAFYNYRMRSLASGRSKHQEDECIFLLEALINMVKRGGRRASHYLFSRMGLLSWLRSVLVSDPILKIVPTNSCRAALLDLIAVTVLQSVRNEADSVTQYDETKALLEEISALAQPTLRLCLDAIGEAQDSGSNKATSSQGDRESVSSLISSSLGALTSLQSAFDGMKEHTSKEKDYSLGIAPDTGIHPSSALRFLARVSPCPSVERSQVLAAFTSLPIDCSHGDSNNPEDPIAFTELILEGLATTRRRRGGGEESSSVVVLSEGWVEQALGRASLLLRLFWQQKSSPSSNGAAIVQKLLDCQSQCFQWSKTRDMWFQCLQELYISDDSVSGMTGTGDSDDLIDLGKYFLEHYSSRPL